MLKVVHDWVRCPSTVVLALLDSRHVIEKAKSVNTTSTPCLNWFNHHHFGIHQQVFLLF